MIGSCDGERTIHLVDPDLEKGGIIALFLHLATTMTLDLHLLKDTGVVDGLLHLLAFLGKYECCSLRNAAIRDLRSDAQISRVDLFVIGALMNDQETCAAALHPRPPPGELWFTSPRAEENYAERNELNPKRIPSAKFESIPREYAQALRDAWVDYDYSAAKKVFEAHTRFKNEIWYALWKPGPRGRVAAENM